MEQSVYATLKQDSQSRVVISMHKTYRGLLLEDDVTQELAKKGLELSRTINQ